MRTIGRYNIAFPDTVGHDEVRSWEPIVVHCALASRVLAVATTRVEGTWKAYCDAVPGRDHRAECDAVLKHECHELVSFQNRSSV